MDPSTTVPGERIFDVALSCLELFRSYPLKARPVAIKIEAERQRFWAWSNTLKVFSKEHFSLDAQLRDPRYAEIKRMVIRLLRVLHNNLKLGMCSCTRRPVLWMDGSPGHIVAHLPSCSIGNKQRPRRREHPGWPARRAG